MGRVWRRAFMWPAASVLSAELVWFVFCLFIYTVSLLCVYFPRYVTAPLAACERTQGLTEWSMNGVEPCPSWFPLNEVQFGRLVHFLEVCLYLDEHNVLHYCGYTKPTDAKRYLNPNSFHPKAVFDSIPFSQMLRTIRNNSCDNNRTNELKQTINHFVSSGYKLEKLNELKTKALQKSTQQHNPINNDTNTLIFPVHYFDGIADLKSLLRSLDNELQQLIGDTRVMVAMKKGSSIGNSVVKNKQLSLTNPDSDTQRCNARGCLQCPLVIDTNTKTVNGCAVRIPKHLNCKSKNVIYMWVCTLCEEKEVYFGRTTQECHNRTSGHRNSFTEEKFDKSALSMHAKEVHQMNFSLNIFRVSVVSKVSPQQLRREEFRFVEKYRTNSLGLNRYKV